MLFAQLLAISASPDSNADEVCPDEFGHGSTELSAFYFTLFYSMFATVHLVFAISSTVLIISSDWNISSSDFELKYSFVSFFCLNTKNLVAFSVCIFMSFKIPSDLSQDYNSCHLFNNFDIHPESLYKKKTH